MYFIAGFAVLTVVVEYPQECLYVLMGLSAWRVMRAA